MSKRDDLRAPITTHAVLLLVLVDGPGHGAVLAERIRDRTRGKLDVLNGALYPALVALAAAGLVVEGPGQGRRRVFALTEAGRQQAEHVRAILAGLVGEEPKANRAQRPPAPRKRTAIPLARVPASPALAPVEELPATAPASSKEPGQRWVDPE